MKDLSSQLRNLSRTAPAAYHGRIAHALDTAADEIDRLQREKHEVADRCEAELAAAKAQAAKWRGQYHYLLRWVTEQYGFPHAPAVEIAAGLAPAGRDEG